MEDGKKEEVAVKDTMGAKAHDVVEGKKERESSCSNSSSSSSSRISSSCKS